MYGGFCDRVQAGSFCWYSGTRRQRISSTRCSPAERSCETVRLLQCPRFCDPQVGSQAGQALRLEQCDPAAAAGCWAAIDRELVHEALRVWLYNPHTLTVLAGRVGSYQFHPYWGLLTGLLWVRGESR
jgi:hypothetical protein